MTYFNKAIAVVAAVLFSAVGLCVLAAGSRVINATYAVGPRFSESSIDAADLAKFDFIYLNAAPEWSPSDFDQPTAEVIGKVSGSHRYDNESAIRKLISTVHANGGKILCSFPGQEFVEIAPNADRSRKFAAVMADFVKKYDYDGIELDWEHTVTEELHASFIHEIRHALDSLSAGARRYWLTTALHHYRKYTPDVAARLVADADWINIMYYDMGGGIWGKAASHNAPLPEMKRSAKEDWNMFPAEKLHIGLPSYGFYYKGVAPSEPVPEGSSLKDFGRYCGYTELPACLESGWTEKWDEAAQSAYFISPDGSEFMTLETERSLGLKVDWILDSGFGGVFWWEYSCDLVRPDAPGGETRHMVADFVTKRVREANASGR